jgi:poly-gamma-glutamate synthesis protein (capsule biosynthesis protein)
MQQRMTDSIRLFLTGDVMTGRGVDQILPAPSDPVLYESYVTDARDYVELAEQLNGRIARPVDHAYVWGDALSVLKRFAPDARIVNLETSVTSCDAFWRGKGINYRMHPRNIPCLQAAQIDCAVLANNHVLDWGYGGLAETMTVLRQGGLRPTGAGMTKLQAHAPGIIDLGTRGRVLIFAFASESSGVPRAWGVGERGMGVNLLPASSHAAAAYVASVIGRYRRQNDLVVVSMHWGDNWGYEIPAEQRDLARALVERVGVDVIHGHSSHHPKGIEILQDRPILYGCGDFINDYEGISGHDAYRGDLRLGYFLEMHPSGGGLRSMDVVPFQSTRLRLNLASQADVEWVEATLRRESAGFGVTVDRVRRDTLSISRASMRSAPARAVGL